jgi:hypothetical protein
MDDPVRFGDRLLAEALRALESDGATPVEDARAATAAAGAGGDLERRIVSRARAVVDAPRLERALRAVRRSIAAIVALGLLLAAAAGAGAAKAALGPGGGAAVNIFWALGGLLGVQTLLLAAWVVILLRAPQSLPSLSLGGAALALGRRLAARLERAEHGAAAVEAVGSVFGRGPLVRSALGSVSNALWLAFNAACLLALLVMLSVREYRFVWETTILSADSYVRATRLAGWLPERLGFRVPTVEQIAASERGLAPDEPPGARQAWSGFLAGSLVAYGLAPRAILLAACLAAQVRARRRFRLDLDRPGYVRLQHALMPRHAALGVVDADDPSAGAERRGPRGAADLTGGGPPALIGLEIEPPASGWPPRAAGTGWRDLGFCDGRPDQERVLGQLAAIAPATPVVVCALTSTPDRGVASFVEEVARASGSAPVLVLTGGEAFRRRGGAAEVAGRVEDWRRLAACAGIDAARVIEVDLDHLTDASAAKLAGALGVPPRAGAQRTAARHLEAAFELVAAHAARWSKAPGVEEQATLHAAIARLHRRGDAARPFTWLAGGLQAIQADAAAALRGGARGVVALLPERARIDPRWLAAGAFAGALGCLAAALLAAPAAIAALPAWSVLGAAVGAAVRAVMPVRPGPAPAPAGDDAARGDALGAAALFAVLLELQGRDEAAITRVLDRVLEAPPGPADVASPGAIRSWLDGLRHRVDLTLAAEVRP